MFVPAVDSMTVQGIDTLLGDYEQQASHRMIAVMKYESCNSVSRLFYTMLLSG